jgi:hypothetical protein
VRTEDKTATGFQPLQIAGISETDEGLNFVTAVIASFAGKSRWHTIWMAPGGVDSNMVLRFRVEGTGGSIFFSPEFTLTSASENLWFVGLER